MEQLLYKGRKKVILRKEADEYKKSFLSLWEENKHKYQFQNSYDNSIPCIEDIILIHRVIRFVCQNY